VPRIIEGFTLCIVYSLCPDKMVDRNTTNSVPLDVAVINYTKSTTKTKKVNSIDLTFAHDVEDHICLIN
jgi:hypothetical protein